MANARPLKKNFHTEMAVSDKSQLVDQLPSDSIPHENSGSGLSLQPIELEPMTQNLNSEPEQAIEQSSVAEAAPSIEQEKQRIKEDNIKALRESKLQAERERDALLAQMMAMQSKAPEKNIIPESEESDFSLNDEDLVDGKTLKKYAKELRATKKELKEAQSANYNAIIESRIKSDFPDIEQVASVENIEYLKVKFPFIASSLASTPDLYNKAAATYTMIKSLGIYKDDSFNDGEKMKKNLEKPRTLTSISPQKGDTPLSHANAFASGLTPELKSQLLKEMNSYRKNR